MTAIPDAAAVSPDAVFMQQPALAKGENALTLGPDPRQKFSKIEKQFRFGAPGIHG